jgi:beta-carotene 15,15'-dioxygenase
MKNFEFKIILSFILLWLGNHLGSLFQIYLAIIGILTIGVLHGTNDLFLIDSLEDSSQKRLQFKLAYIFIIIINLILFYIFPLIGLIVFIAFSAYHFGEQHLESLNLEVKNIFKGMFFGIYGGLIFGLLFVAHSKEVIDIVFEITNFSISNKQLVYFIFTMLILYILMTTLILINSKKYKNHIFKELFTLAVLIIIMMNATLIWSFAIYFILWHSMPSIADQVIFRYKIFNIKNLWNYLLSGILFWIISIIGLSVLLYFLKGDKHFYTVLFVFLAAITLPHVLIMQKVIRKSTS